MSVQKIVILLNRCGPSLACWEQALQCALTIMHNSSVSLQGFFVTGHAVKDITAGTVPAPVLACARQLADSGVSLTVCRSRLPDEAPVALPAGFVAGSLGQWMNWLESADCCLEWV